MWALETKGYDIWLHPFLTHWYLVAKITVTDAQLQPQRHIINALMYVENVGIHLIIYIIARISLLIGKLE